MIFLALPSFPFPKTNHGIYLQFYAALSMVPARYNDGSDYLSARSPNATVTFNSP